MSEPTLASWGFVALIQFELAAGCAFLANICPALLRRLGLLLFAAFSGVASSKAACGARSCGCAGIDISPWVALVADALILMALWRWRPGSWPVSVAVRGFLAAALVVAVALPVAAAFRPLPYPRLVVTPVDHLGEVGPSEHRSFQIWLRNPHDQPVEILAVESSCPCLEARGLPCRLRPGEGRALELALDFSREPEFSGAILLNMTGRTAGGTVAFTSEVAMKVRGQAPARELKLTAIGQ